MTKEGPYGIDIDKKVRSNLKNVVDTAELKGLNKGIETVLSVKGERMPRR